MKKTGHSITKVVHYSEGDILLARELTDKV